MSNTDNPEYPDLLGVKDKRIDPSKNPNYRRFQGLSNMIKILKHDHDVIKNTPVEPTNETNHHVKSFLKEKLLNSIKMVENYYEGEIQLVKKKLETGNKIV